MEKQILFNQNAKNILWNFPFGKPKSDSTLMLLAEIIYWICSNHVIRLTGFGLCSATLLRFKLVLTTDFLPLGFQLLYTFCRKSGLPQSSVWSPIKRISTRPTGEHRQNNEWVANLDQRVWSPRLNNSLFVYRALPQPWSLTL